MSDSTVIPAITFEELEQIPAAERLVIDVRPTEQSLKGSFPDALSIDADDLERWLADPDAWTGPDDEGSRDPAEVLGGRDKRTPVYIMCHTGERSLEDTQLLVKAGYNAVNVEGGYRSYLTIKLGRMLAGGAQSGDASDDVTDSTPQVIELNRPQEDDRPQKTPEQFRREVERSIIKTYRKSIWRPFTKALKEYELIKDGDRIAVCISGGKDSMLMAKLMQEIQKHGIMDFELLFLCMDPGYNPDNRRIIEQNAELLGIPITFFASDIFDTVAQIEQNPCYLCARMRRGHLYANAKAHGCNKIALGHHFDDVIETILMGMLYSAKVETMMPKLHSLNFEGMELIRPMYLVKEEAVKAWRDHHDLHFIQCACRFTENCASCGGDKPSKRDEMKALIAAMRKTNPHVDTNIYNSVKNINLKTVIGYHKGDMNYNFLDDYDD